MKKTFLDYSKTILEKVSFNTSCLSTNENETLAFLSYENPNFAMNDGPLGVPSFFLGCTFNVVGMLVVYLATDSKEEVRKSLLGVIAQTVIGIVIITADSSNGASGCASPSIQLSGCTSSGCATGGSGCSSSSSCL